MGDLLYSDAVNLVSGLDQLPVDIVAVVSFISVTASLLLLLLRFFGLGWHVSYFVLLL